MSRLLTDEDVNALKQIYHYLEDEAEQFEEYVINGEDPENHIIQAVGKLGSLLQDLDPEDETITITYPVRVCLDNGEILSDDEWLEHRSGSCKYCTEPDVYGD